MHTPWGESEEQQTYAKGITFYQTPSHGGFHVLPDQNAKIHTAWRREDGWYEEDCDWAIVAMTFPDLFDAEHVESARNTAKAWHPHAYMAVTGETLEPKDSFVLQRQLFAKKHADDWVVVAALSSKTRPGMVDCIAIKGGQGSHGPERRFLIPSEEYKPGQFGFVVPNGTYPYFDGPRPLWDDVSYVDPSPREAV
ncbi:hypothetical protein CCR94_18165 [Rhodoblastus sphagnicola]|uniref:DUF7007 domain-containing protein n=1 Tax=Rhodoblastus sphagnicola TaxID=333368 RepID=A0A2S6N0S9_9HYPH|nr:hypothetical protein [Rhodoblastus sphagnicola]MBB4200580.1 hypothetical protein [Rhodoblastus sphagnicola]PPQ28224.1 hypothetical protein CCR94_18165 [Rhodoblastus sphagnicola]